MRELHLGSLTNPENYFSPQERFKILITLPSRAEKCWPCRGEAASKEHRDTNHLYETTREALLCLLLDQAGGLPQK
jgi:hypothetical protein